MYFVSNFDGEIFNINKKVKMNVHKIIIEQ